MTKLILVALIVVCLSMSAMAIVIGGDPGPSTPPPPTSSTPIAAPITTSVPTSSTSVSDPVAAPLDLQIDVPVATPVTAPVDAPVSTPIDVPVTTPIDTPIDVPISAPVDAPVDTPVTVPVAVPLTVPLATPVAVPVAAPVRAPVAAPVAAPNPVRSAYIGCFQDSASRDLPFKAYANSSNSNVLCLNVCRFAGYAYSGTQNTNECWCGNTYGGQGKFDDKLCTMSCSGNSNQTCGGPYRNSVYRTPARYIGCFADSSNRDMKFNGYWGNTKSTPELCQSVCSKAGYVFAGLQTGTECWCGNSYGSQGRLSENSCNKACTGKSTAKCGGDWANAVYRL